MRGEAGVVDQTGHGPEVGGGREQPVDGVLVGDLTGHRDRLRPSGPHLREQLLGRRPVGAVAEGQVVTAPGEQQRGRRADAAGAPGDDRDRSPGGVTGSPSPTRRAPARTDRHDLRMTGALIVRDATLRDAEACCRVYAPYVTDSAISFETEPPDVEEMTARMAASLEHHAWLVLEDGGRVVGYAYGAPFAQRAAYRWACSTSIYLEPGRRRTGGGRLLYEALLARLTALGYRQAMAGLTLPNEASEGLHRALGYAPAGTYRRVGWKHGAWHDVGWLQRSLGDDDGPPREPRLTRAR